MIFGDKPALISSGMRFEAWTEFMHYQYLPVIMPGIHEPRIPERLRFAWQAIYLALLDAARVRDLRHDYVYLTARCGWASPDNPLNRPGWHTDGFGTDDVNYVWCDRFPTRWIGGSFGGISEDHVESMVQFEELAQVFWHQTVLPGSLYRFSPTCIHATPEIPAPGGMRRFLKISVSRDRYNLVGNSHNHLFDYDWPLVERSEIRNDPAAAVSDHVEVSIEEEFRRLQDARP